MKELKIDSELKDLLPPLTNEEYKQLEKNIIENGFDRNFPIMEWHGYIADGHNRYSICKKHNIEPAIGTLAYDTKEEVMEWMLDIQLGRRNLSPIQRIKVTEKYRPIYERKARENMSLGGKNYSPKEGLKNSSTLSKEEKIDVRAKLAETAGVSTDTYSKGKKILDSNNEILKQEVLSGEKSINAGYKELIQSKEKKKTSINGEITNISSSTAIKPTIPKTQISDEVKQICADLKIEKTKEYLDSIWDYKVAIIECMNADFEMYYDGFVSILNDMENRVTKRELNECIKNAENIVEKMLSAIEEAKKTTIKTED
ncbi:hypothetical protein FMM74_017205 [Lachnospiraceae bacterium MD308]|nr:hypothetical protein [Lachnospiraceae bacterium MD308]